MKIGRIIILSVLGLLLCLSVILAQLAFRVERTMLSYSYTSKQIDRIITPLYDSAIHRETVDETFSYLRRALSLRVPAALQPHIVDAAVSGFNPEWFTRTAQRMLFNTQLVLNGKETDLSLPVSINSFKLAFMDIVRAEFDTSEYLEIDREVSRMPSSLDLADEIPEESRRKLIRYLRSVGTVLTVLEYAVPGLLILLCFVLRRFGAGLTAVGGGFIAGGGALAIAVAGWKGSAARGVAAAVGRAVPSFLGWIDYGVGGVTEELIAGLLPVSLIVLASGALLFALGIFLVLVKGDPEIRLGGGGE